MQATPASAVRDIVPFGFKLIPAHKPEELHDNMRSSIARGLPVVSLCAAHDMVLSVAGGGPSLEDTYKELTGYVAAVNGSLAFLLDKGVIPQMCGICDPSPHMADIIEADPRVTYFVASIVHPTVFDKLINAGCRVYRWNCSSIPGGEELLDKIEPGHLIIGGGSTMGLRWITLGYSNGFRKFHLHGFDSSFRGKSSHAYPDHQDAKDWIGFEGFQTRPNFIGQVVDFIGWMERLKSPDVEPVDIKVFGDGLLQTKFREWKALNPGMHEGQPKRPLFTDNFVWPAGDKLAMPAILADAGHIASFMGHVRERGVVVQAGGNVGIYPAHLAQYFNAVHTFEPDLRNYECLAKNLGENKGKIVAYHAALGAEDGTCSTEMYEPHNSGAIRTVPGSDVPVRTIDDLNLDVCDLIWLDIEGAEPEALKGGTSTIDRLRPAIIIEETGRSVPPYAAREWLEDRGYREEVQYGNDVLFLPPVKPWKALPTSGKPVTSLTIVAVQAGNYLGRGGEYVEKLFQAVERHLPAGIGCRLVCLTDDPWCAPDFVQPLPLEPGLKGWWNKLALFKPGMFEPGERVLYFDLDTLIIGGLDDIANYAGRFAIMRDVYRPDGLQSSVMAWEAGACDQIWTAWEAQGKPQFHPGGDQAWIEMVMPEADRWQDLYPGQIVSYKADCRRKHSNKPPMDARICVFHGSPRPHEAAATVPWVADAWGGQV